MAKEVQAVLAGTGLIAQDQAEYEAIRAQITEHYQQARELRNQADKLKQSGRTDAQVMTKVNQSLDQAERLASLAEQLDAYERLEAIRNMNELEIEASVLKEKIVDRTLKLWSPEALEARREYRRQYEREYRRNWRQKPENRLKVKEYEHRYWERKAQQSNA